MSKKGGFSVQTDRLRDLMGVLINRNEPKAWNKRKGSGRSWLYKIKNGKT
jgi:hypothetical protein